SGLAIPNYCSLALVGNPDGGEIFGTQLFSPHGFSDNFLRAAPDFIRIVLDPPRLGEDLFVFLLSNGNDPSGMVEDDKTCAGRALIDGPKVCCHLDFLLIENIKSGS